MSDRPQARGEALARPRSRRGVASRTRVSRVRTDGGAGKKKEQGSACPSRWSENGAAEAPPPLTDAVAPPTVAAPPRRVPTLDAAAARSSMR